MRTITIITIAALWVQSLATAAGAHPPDANDPALHVHAQQTQLPVVDIPELSDPSLIDLHDGSVEDWIDIFDEPTLVLNDFISLEASQGTQITTDDLDLNVYMAWSAVDQRLYFALERRDDVQIVEGPAYMADDYDGNPLTLAADGVEMTIDGDNSGLPALGWSLFWMTDSDWHGNDPGYQDYFTINPQLDSDHTGDWFIGWDDFNWHGNEMPAEGDDWFIGWDDFNWQAPNPHISHEFADLPDITSFAFSEVEDANGTTNQWALGGQSDVFGNASLFSDHILLPTDEPGVAVKRGVERDGGGIGCCGQSEQQYMVGTEVQYGWSYPGDESSAWSTSEEYVEAGGTVYEDINTVTINEISLTPFDFASAEGPQYSQPSVLEPGKIIGVRISVPDMDETPGQYSNFFTLSFNAHLVLDNPVAPPVIEGVDLITTAVSSATSAQSLEQISFDVTIKNQGNVAVDSQDRFKVGAYISPDPIITKEDSLVGGVFVYGMEVGEIKSMSISSTVPRYVDGPYYVGAIVNYHAIGVAEVDTTNNEMVGHTIDINQVFPDLITTAVSGPASAQSAQQHTVDVMVKNIGPISVHSQERFRVGVYLSTDPVITTDDTPIGAQFNYGLEPGLTESMPITVSVPAGMAGIYYLGAIANYHSIGILEGDMTNNSLAGGQIAIDVLPADPAVLVSPIDNAVVGGATVTLEWDPVAGADQYGVWVSDGDVAGNAALIDIVVDGALSANGTITYAMTAPACETCDWWIQGVNAFGDGPWSAKETYTMPGGAAKTVAVPQDFALRPNHPNPFNPETQIGYQLPQAGEVQLAIFNALGQQVRMLEQSYRQAGYHQLSWDGRDDQGQIVAGGVYLYRLQSGEFSQTRRMLFIK